MPQWRALSSGVLLLPPQKPKVSCALTPPRRLPSPAPLGGWPAHLPVPCQSLSSPVPSRAPRLVSSGLLRTLGHPRSCGDLWLPVLTRLPRISPLDSVLLPFCCVRLLEQKPRPDFISFPNCHFLSSRPCYSLFFPAFMRCKCIKHTWWALWWVRVYVHKDQWVESENTVG